MSALLAVPPKHMRKIWRNVTGERLWYALHGYAIQAEKSQRGMFGHARVLPPELRNRDLVKPIARMLVIKAARRMRKAGYYSNRLYFACEYRRDGTDKIYSESLTLPTAKDDKACLDGLDTLWSCLCQRLCPNARIIRVGITLGELSVATERQLDMLLDDDDERRRWERVSCTVDALNTKHSTSLVTEAMDAPNRQASGRQDFLYAHSESGGLLVSWKTELQLMDIPQSQRLEVTCTVCGHSRYENAYQLANSLCLSFEYLDEVERQLTCHNRTCRGTVRIALANAEETEGFVGGLA